MPTVHDCGSRYACETQLVELALHHHLRFRERGVDVAARNSSAIRRSACRYHPRSSEATAAPCMANFPD